MALIPTRKKTRGRRRRTRAVTALPVTTSPRSGTLPRILRRIYIAVFLLLLMVGIGTLGLKYGSSEPVVWSDALYMSLITITTVGYGEIIPIETTGERIFIGLLAIGGFGVLTFLFTSVAVFFLENDLDVTLRRKRMEKEIKRLSGHYVICGFGRVGRNVAQELDATHRDFVAIDPNLEMLELYKDRSPDLLFLHGDAADDDLLLAADIGDAAGVFAVTGDDSKNLMVVFTARQLNPKVRVVARCHELRNMEKMRRAGADMVVSPDFTGGMRIASAMIRPRVVSFLDEMLRQEHALRLEEVPLPLSFRARPLEHLQLRGPHYILLAVRTDTDWLFNPGPEFMLQPGHTLVCMASPHGRKELESAIARATYT